jgi:VanZ family protein
MNLRTISAILFFTLLAALIALTYWPDMPDVKLRIRHEWIRLDYIGHLGFYAAVAFSFILWRVGWRKKIPLLLLVLTLAAGIALGIVTEYSQQLIPGRSFNPMDMLYNCVGVTVGVVVGWWSGEGVKG